MLTEFISGAFVYLVVRKLTLEGDPSRNVQRGALVLSWVVPLIIVVISIGLGNIGSLQFPGLPNEAPRLYVIIVPFLVAWIGALALTNRGPTSFLSTRQLVLGGFISYSLYMVHLVWFGLWRTGMSAVGITGGPLYLLGVIGLIVMAVALAYLMWRFVEEPAREWMRSKIGVKKVPFEEAAMHVGTGPSDGDSTPVPGQDENSADSDSDSPSADSGKPKDDDAVARPADT